MRPLAAKDGSDRPPENARCTRTPGRLSFVIQLTTKIISALWVACPARSLCVASKHTHPHRSVQ